MILLGPGDNLAATRMRADPTPATVPGVGTIQWLVYQTDGELRIVRNRFGTTCCIEWCSLWLGAV